MLSILKKTDDGLVTVNELSNGSWICAVDPDTEELARLHELGVPESFITSSLDVDERARTDKEDGATLIVLRVPYDCGPSADVRYKTVTLGIVLVNEYLVTICKYQIAVLDSLIQSRMRVVSTAKRNRLILHILLVTAQSYLNDLRRINSAVETIEHQLQRSLKNEEVLQLLAYQKSLVYFTTGLKSNELMMHRLQRNHLFEMYPDDQELLDDVLTENTQATEMTAISSNILSQMMDAYASIISNNLNVVMKFLASATIVLSFPTIVASIYGMNVTLPGAKSPVAFFVVMGAAFCLSLLVAVIFWRRKWF